MEANPDNEKLHRSHTKKYSDAAPNGKRCSYCSIDWSFGEHVLG